MIGLVGMFIGMFVISFFVMPFVMIDSPADWRPALNQAYGALFMSAAMVALMRPRGAALWIAVGLMAVAAAGVRWQIGVGDREYLHDMLPHHSMAVLTSRAALAKTQSPEVYQLASGILKTQEEEIAAMKGMLSRGSGLLSQELRP